MIARRQRLTLGSDYRMVVRRGSRCAGRATITHVQHSGEERVARFGFIVSKAVGNAVTRNTVRRRLKAICASLADEVRPGADVVIRALPSAAAASYHELHAEVSRCLARRAAV